MKNIIAIICISLFASSCSKQEFTETKNTVSKADSLFRQAKKGLATLDSISKRLNDSNGVAKKILAPKIREQTKKIDSSLKSGKWQIDSMRKEIQHVAKNVKVGADMAKTLDSANDMLQNGENAISVLSKTADRILRQTKNISAGTETDNVPKKVAEQKEVSGTNRASIEINVSDLAEAKASVLSAVRDHAANLQSEEYSNNETVQREKMTAVLSAENLRLFVDELSGVGSVTEKEIMQTGANGELATVEIVLTQKMPQLAAQNIPANDPSAVQDDPTLGDDLTVDVSAESDSTLAKLLPFIPLLLMCVIIILVIRAHHNKKKGYIDVEKPADQREERPQDRTPNEALTDKDPQDYSKYMPKK